MTNLQIAIKAIAEFCKDCPKNNTVECDPNKGDYCDDLTKRLFEAAEGSEE